VVAVRIAGAPIVHPRAAARRAGAIFVDRLQVAVAGRPGLEAHYTRRRQRTDDASPWPAAA